MRLTLEKPEEEKLLRRVARSRGLKPDALILMLLQEAEAQESAFNKNIARSAALLSEAKLRKLWDTPEEDAAWSHLQTPSTFPTHVGAYRRRGDCYDTDTCP
nr:hypothetical protein [Armatimonas sp.]